jgi:hypothetical protein
MDLRAFFKQLVLVRRKSIKADMLEKLRLGYGVDQEVISLCPGDGSGNILPLKSFSVAVFGVIVPFDRHLDDKHFAGLRKQDWRLGRDHLYKIGHF